jgi:hypothetical protein
MTEPVHILHPSLWEKLVDANPRDVCIRSGATFDDFTGSYTLDFLQERYRICPYTQEFEALAGPLSSRDHSIELKVTLITYLINAKEISLVGKLITGSNLKGGKTFFQGTHSFPIEPLLEQYGQDPQGFLAKGLSIGATQASFGDVSLRLPVLPRVPVIMVLWVADEEFSARLNVLFDASIDQHLPLDSIYGLVSEICHRMKG